MDGSCTINRPKRRKMTHRKCRTWRCGFTMPNDKDHCPNCGMPKGVWQRILTYLRFAPKHPNLRQAESEVWSTINSVRDELQRLTTLERDLTGYHKPKMNPTQKEALQKGKAHITRKAKPGLLRLKAIEAARWQNVGFRWSCASPTRARATPSWRRSTNSSTATPASARP